MAKRSPAPAAFFRTAVLVLLSVLLLGRLGPFCEAVAQAAPVVSAMTGCDGDGTGAPDKKDPLAACSSPCMAVSGETLARIEPTAMRPIAPWPSSLSGLIGWPIPPATPPPRRA